MRLFHPHFGLPVAALSVALLVPSRAAAAPTCLVVNVTPLNFGVYDLTSTVPLDSVGELSVECSQDTPVQIIMGRGISGHQAPREMRARGISLNYNLFQDAPRLITWGDGTEGTQVMMGLAPARQTLRLPIFGRVFPLQGVPSGVYTDRIPAVVIF